MEMSAEHLSTIEASVSQWISLVGTCIEVFGVFIIVAGIVFSTHLFLFERIEARSYDEYKIRIGRSLLLGLEVLVAADIIKTIAIELTFRKSRPPCRTGVGPYLLELDAGARN